MVGLDVWMVAPGLDLQRTGLRLVGIAERDDAPDPHGPTIPARLTMSDPQAAPP